MSNVTNQQYTFLHSQNHSTNCYCIMRSHKCCVNNTSIFNMYLKLHEKYESLTFLPWWEECVGCCRVIHELLVLAWLWCTERSGRVWGMVCWTTLALSWKRTWRYGYFWSIWVPVLALTRGQDGDCEMRDWVEPTHSYGTGCFGQFPAENGCINELRSFWTSLTLLAKLLPKTL